jgi:hypothetical protein
MKTPAMDQALLILNANIVNEGKVFPSDVQMANIYFLG